MSLLWADGFGGAMQGLDKYEQFDAAYSASYGRNGVGIQISALEPSGTVALDLPLDPSDEVTVGAWHYVNGAPTQSHGTDTVFALQESGGSFWKLQWLHTNQLRIVDPFSTVSLVGSVGSVPRLTWHYIEWQLSFVNQTVEVRVNGETLYLDSTPSAGQIERLWCERNRQHAYWLDDLYVLNSEGSTFNDFLGLVRLETLDPDGDGSRTDLTPSTGTDHYALVNDGSDSTYVEGSAGDGDLYDFADTADSDSILGVFQVARMFDSASAGITGRAICKPSTTEHDGDDHSLGSLARAYGQAWPVDPDTASAWTQSGVNGAEFGVEFA